MKLNIKYSFVFLILLINACSKDTAVSTAPVIKLLDIKSTNIKEFKDSIEIHIEYTDENGDIGQNDPDKNDLYIKDRRLTEADFYFIKPLAPPNSSIKITGTIVVHIKNTFLLGNGNSEKTVFDIKLRDRAGNWSNGISTPEITIVK